MDCSQLAQDLAKRLQKGQEVHKVFLTVLKEQMLINDKPISYWKSQFTLIVPSDNMSPAICRELDIKLIEMTQMAGFFYAAASAKLKILRSGNEATYRNKFFEIVQEYKGKGEKLPAKDTIENMARVSLEDVETSTTIAEIEKDFWRDILENLNTCRKLIENSTWNNKTEMDVHMAKNYGG